MTVENCNPQQDIHFKRLLNAIGWNIVIQGLLTVLFVFLLNADLLNPMAWAYSVLNEVFNFRSLPNLISITVITVFQGIIYGKRYLKAPKKYYKRIQGIINLISYDNLAFSCMYALGGYLSLRLYSSLTNGSIALRKNCENIEGHVCIAEANLFYQLGGIWIGLYYFSKNNFFHVDMLQFPHIQQNKILQIKTSANNIFISGCHKGLRLAIYYTFFYWLMGSAIRKSSMDTFGLFIEDAPLDTIFTFFSGSFIKLWIYFAFFCISIQMFELVFSIVLTEEAKFPLTSIDSITLLQALEIDSLYLNLLAAQDLKQIASKDYKRRQEIFSLSLPGGHPHCWKKILNQCIKKIDAFTLLLEEVSTFKRVEPKNCDPPKLQPYFIKSPNLRPMSNSTIAQSLNKNRECKNRLLQHLKENMDTAIQYLLRQPAINYIFGDVPQWHLKHVLTEAQPVVWMCESLSQLCEASVKEDKYGIVQNDLNIIITKLINIKQTLDKLNKTGLFLRKHDLNDNYSNKMKVTLNSAVKRSIYRIVIKFSKHFYSFNLSHDVQNALEPFIAFKEI